MYKRPSGPKARLVGFAILGQRHDLTFWRNSVERDRHVLAFRPADGRIDVPLYVYSWTCHRMQIVCEPVAPVKGTVLLCRSPWTIWTLLRSASSATMPSSRGVVSTGRVGLVPNTIRQVANACGSDQHRTGQHVRRSHQLAGSQNVT